LGENELENGVFISRLLDLREIKKKIKLGAGLSTLKNLNFQKNARSTKRDPAIRTNGRFYHQFLTP